MARVKGPNGRQELMKLKVERKGTGELWEKGKQRTERKTERMWEERGEGVHEGREE